jgi:hypothetical protein
MTGEETASETRGLVTSHVYYAKRTRMDHFGIGAAVFEKAGARPTAQAETPFANSHRSALRSGAADRGLAKSPQQGVRTQREASKKPRSLDLQPFEMAVAT